MITLLDIVGAKQSDSGGEALEGGADKGTRQGEGVLGAPTSLHGADVSAPQFESPKCIRICARITHKYS
jgi:hypothetical protein